MTEIVVITVRLALLAVAHGRAKFGYTISNYCDISIKYDMGSICPFRRKAVVTVQVARVDLTFRAVRFGEWRGFFLMMTRRRECLQVQ